MSDLARQLNELFHTVLRPGTDELWNNETAAWEIARSGPPVSAAYLSQLRTGKRHNPSARHLAALAALFDVPLEYFFPQADGSRPQPGRHPSPTATSRLLMLLDGVSPAGVADIERTIADVRAAEELPPVPADRLRVPSASLVAAAGPPAADG